jgi:pimeloyl-ACP methyl ester carboxylesterase
VEEAVELVNAHGVRLAATLSHPAVDRPLPLVISCHGFGGSKDNPISTALARRLTERGIAVLRFDFTGHGESEGSIAEVTISRGVEDLSAAFAFASGLSWIERPVLGLIGHSFGGTVAFTYAARHDEVRRIVLLAPVSDYVALKHRKLGPDGIMSWETLGYTIEDTDTGPARLNYAFYEDAWTNDLYALAKHNGASCLILHGDADNPVPLEQSRALIDALGPGSRLDVVAAADHGFSGPGQLDHVATQAADFLGDHVPGRAR